MGKLSRGRATVARQAHNLKIAGSIPAPATFDPYPIKWTPNRVQLIIVKYLI